LRHPQHIIDKVRVRAKVAAAAALADLEFAPARRLAVDAVLWAPRSSTTSRPPPVMLAAAARQEGVNDRNQRAAFVGLAEAEPWVR
jgi:hypothetical protein